MISRLVTNWHRAVLLGVFGSHAVAQTPSVRLVLDFAIQGQQSPFVLAADGGYFARAGVNVQIDRGYGSADAVTKVASGAYDMAFADIGALIQFNAKQVGPHVVNVFQVYDVAPMLILSLKKSNIKKPADLAGKRLASPPGASSRVMFPLFAAANGLESVLGELDRRYTADCARPCWCADRPTPPPRSSPISPVSNVSALPRAIST